MMDEFTTPPPIPSRNRQHGRRKSLQGPSAHSSNRVHIQPASPEVISSLITSLSIISSPANQLFESTGAPQPSPVSPTSTNATYNTFGNLNAHNGQRSSGGSFGIDYGAYEQPSLRQLIEEESLDELAAPTPVIRTSKPPSGFSPLTAPKSPADSSPLKTFLRGSSRPSSKGSNASKDRDDASSIGNVSIEPGVAPTHELRRRSSGDSWGKKQGRNQRGLMYMSSRERLREKEQEKKRVGVAAVGSNTKAVGLERTALPTFESDSFMAEDAIGEEPEDMSPTKHIKDPVTPPPKDRTDNANLAFSTGSQGGIGSGRFIPTRDSSLRKPVASTKKRSSHRPGRQNGKGKAIDEGPSILHEKEEQPQERKRDRTSRHQKTGSTEAASKMMEPLDDLKMPRPAKPINGQKPDKSDHLKVAEDVDEGAPSPAVAQRKARSSLERGDRSSSQKRNSGKVTPEPLDSQPKRTGSRLKRLSAPLSPRASDKDAHQRAASNPLSRVGSPEPTKPQIHVDDRPTSADSIDDAVDAYLFSPRLSQKIRHPQTGRVISFSEVGDSEGFAVFCCVGMGLTRYITAFYDELALTLKLRLITPDRPGVGDSEPYNDGTATPLSWPDDVYAICQTLKITKFSILAHSAGAIYALATALRMPQHIRGRIHLLAPWIPPSQLNVFGAQVASPPTNSIPTSQRILRALPTPILKAANSSFMSATSSSITSSLPKSQRRGKRKSTGRDTPGPPSGRNTVTPGPDKENHGRNSTIYPDPSEKSAMEKAAKDPNDPNHESAILAAAANTLADKERQMTYDTRLTHAIWDLATSGANPAVDLLVCLERRHTIGFRYVDISRPVVIHHGSKDTRVPVENVRWLGKTMRRCEVRVLEGEGHGLMASAAVMGGVLMEIAREWDDWMKVTGSTGGTRGEGGRRTLKERASVQAFR